ncbi:MAG TPA: GNAT family N-acetyltransferase [Tepidiformaceae bacterium]|nr:GNAT family N-acetyltransferase [Tepidiformaceae bacterium]
MNIVIRPAVPADAPALYRSWQELRKHNASVDRRIVPAPVSEREFTAGLEELLTRPSSAVFVADGDGRVVGFIRAGIEANLPDRLPEQHVSIGYLFVEPSVRRRGLGRRLFEAVCEWAGRQDGASHFEMTVLNADEDAERFWRSLGFSPFIQRLWAPLTVEEQGQ